MTESTRRPGDRPAGGAEDRWAERIAAIDAPTREPRRTLSSALIVDRAFELIASDGYEAVTMRRIAASLGTGPASLYAHVRSKTELDELLIGGLCRSIEHPRPDPAHWREQFVGVCADLRDAYLRYPGIAAAAFGGAATSPDALRVAESLLAILLAGGIDAQRAAWTTDAAFVYVSGFSLERSTRDRAADRDGGIEDPRDIAARLRMLPAALFPQTVAHADAVTSGDAETRFAFTLHALLAGVAASDPSP